MHLIIDDYGPLPAGIELSVSVETLEGAIIEVSGDGESPIEVDTLFPIVTFKVNNREALPQPVGAIDETPTPSVG